MIFNEVKVDTEQNNFVGLKNKKIILPRNFVIENLDYNQKKDIAENFMKYFEKFVHILMSKENNNNPLTIIIKKPNEEGEFDEAILHSTKFDAWHKLEKCLRKNILNRKSNILIYNDFFSSKSIERTISKGTFLLASNNSPIFNQGLINSDKTYRIHTYDDLYKFASFILNYYSKELGINKKILSIFKFLSREFEREFGFIQKMDLSSVQTKDILITTLDSIITKIQPTTSEIKELILSTKRMILGLDIHVGIDNFEIVWEELFTKTSKDYYGKNNFFDEQQISFSENSNPLRTIIRPDAILLKKTSLDNQYSLHVFDTKYKKHDFLTLSNALDAGKCEDWIKQMIYVDNYLSPEINELNNNILVDTNLYLIIPSQKSHFSYFKIYSYYIFIIELNLIELMKIYNKEITNDFEKNKTFQILDNITEQSKLIYPNNRYKPWIPTNCLENGKVKTASTYNNVNNRYYSYKEYLFQTHQHTSENLKYKEYFATKKIINNKDGTFDFESF
ncbi:hypothetical protein [Aliarcobacter butzleri]|jgi:hypothetical protein|uniref:hypothetical protein n=1 Tax=Aliarcobacter butzleri TaxID=28197 RepID=UPI001EDA08D9|nr:hypothetical protein [Aliarcobacter butzleri]MCG3689257.1 hypothetical protein [Aliarcobacter butzleri]